MLVFGLYRHFLLQQPSSTFAPSPLPLSLQTAPLARAQESRFPRRGCRGTHPGVRSYQLVLMLYIDTGLFFRSNMTTGLYCAKENRKTFKYTDNEWRIYPGRNSPDSAPILRLPAELLSVILLIYRDASTRRGERPYQWLQITHVCRHFREVALECAPLWADIEVSIHDARLERTRQMVLRSRQAPLSIRSLANESEEFIRLVIREMYHTETLRLVLSSHLLLAGTPAPNLRELDLRIYLYRTEMRISEIFGFQGIPRLERMRVASYAGLVWEESAFPKTLRELDISQFNRTPRPLHQVLGVLNGLPLLESLSLEGLLPAFPPNEDCLPEVKHAITLSRLRRLALVGSASRTAVFLSNVIVPNLVDLRIKCVVTSAIALALLAPVISSRLSDDPTASSAKQFLSFALDESSGLSETRLVAWSSLEHKDGLPVPDAPLERTLTMTIRHDHHLETLPTFLDQIPISGIQMLNVCVGVHSRSLFASDKMDAWRTAFRSVLSLRELHVVGKQHKAFPFRKPQSPDMMEPPHFPSEEFFGELDERAFFHDHIHRQAMHRRALRGLDSEYRHSLCRRIRPTEQDHMWTTLRTIFPSLDTCTLNETTFSVGHAPVTGTGMILNYPLIMPA